MNLRDIFDQFIEESVITNRDPEISVTLLLSEDFVVRDGEDGLMTLQEALLTEMHTKYQNVPGAGRRKVRSVGRKDPKRQIAGRIAARKGRSKRMMAQRNPKTKMKRKRTMAFVNRMNAGKKKGRFKVRKPKVRFKRTKRPTFKRAKRPSFRRAGGFRGAHGTRRHGPPRVQRYRR